MTAHRIAHCTTCRLRWEGDDAARHTRGKAHAGHVTGVSEHPREQCGAWCEPCEPCMSWPLCGHVGVSS